MLEDGEYAAWFKTPRGEGTGTIFLANGGITGGDTVLTYSGWYEVDQDRFTATVSTKRHSAGQPTLFGIDEIELTLEGHASGTVASCSGTAEQAPELPFHATLIRVQARPRAPAAIAGKRKSANSRVRQRSPFALRPVIKSP